MLGEYQLHYALPFRMVGNGPGVNVHAEVFDLKRTRYDATIAIRIGMFRFFKNRLKSGLADSLTRVGQSLGNADGHPVAGVAGAPIPPA